MEAKRGERLLHGPGLGPLHREVAALEAFLTRLFGQRLDRPHHLLLRGAQSPPGLLQGLLDQREGGAEVLFGGDDAAALVACSAVLVQPG